MQPVPFVFFLIASIACIFIGVAKIATGTKEIGLIWIMLAMLWLMIGVRT